jgi:hypothetical protein
MSVKQVTKKEAIAIFNRYGLFIGVPEMLVWRDGLCESGHYTGMVCDYTKLKGYTVAYACDIRSKGTLEQHERFNIMR